MNDTEVIGLGMLGIGSFFFVLGILLLLDRALLTMSNILILLGITVLMKPNGFYSFVTQKGRAQGSIAFFLGIFLVICKLPLPGIICEVTGAYWLFGGFWPMLLSLLLKIPHITSFVPFLSKAKDETLPL